MNTTVSSRASAGKAGCRLLAAYTILFAVLFFCCFGIYLFLYQKSFFRSYDGLNQHYMAFTYLGKLGRSVIRTFLKEHRLVIPLWDAAIGYGADIPTSMTAYLWDPFNLISLLIPSRWSEQGFALMVTAKFYFTGISWLLFARQRRLSSFAALCGAILYTFSGVAFVGFDQSFFLNPMYIFPLLIAGADRLFEQGKPVLYTCMLAFSFANYFYFAYMMCIFVFFYWLLRVLTEWSSFRTLRRVLCSAGSFFLFSVLAAGLAAVCLLPVILVMSNAGRLSAEHYLPLFYSRQYYRGVFLGFITFNNMLFRDNMIGFGAVSLTCVGIIYSFPKKYARLRIEFLLLSAGLCLPFFGHVMNGFNYVANRWVWAYGLLIAFMASAAIQEMRNLTRKQLLFTALFTAAYLAAAFLYFRAGRPAFYTSAALLVLFTVLCFFFPRCPARLFRGLTLGIICLSLVCSAHFVFSRSHDKGFDHLTDAGTAFDTVMNAGGLPLLNQVDTGDGSRFDRYGLNQISNATWLYGVSGMNFYDSIYNNYIDEFHKNLSLNTSASAYAYNGLDRRSEPEALMNVRHFFTRGDNPVRPVGYEEPEAEMIITLNKNETGLIPLQSYGSDIPYSLFYLFSRAVSYEEYMQLSPPDRQQALMKAVVTDSGRANARTDDLALTASGLSWQTDALSNLSADGSTYTAGSEGGYMDLLLDSPVGAQSGELYVFFDDIRFSAGDRQGYLVSASGLHGDQAVPACEDSFTGSTIYNPSHNGRTQWLLNLGNPSSEVDRIRIRFQTPGTYSIGSLSVCFRPAEDIRKNLAGLKSAASDIRTGQNFLSCDVSPEQEGYLFLSVPYSAGWKVWDNGQKAEILRADDAFMAVPVSAGDHHLEFRYRTPGLLPGLAVSLLSLLTLIYISRRNFRKS